MTTEAEFDRIVATAPANIRAAVREMAWGNAWSAETYGEYSSDAERWTVACATAEMVLNDPADYGLPMQAGPGR